MYYGDGKLIIYWCVDWVQDAAKEQLRRKVKRKETAGFFERGGRAGWRYSAWESYDAAQGWIVVTIIGENVPNDLDELFVRGKC